MAEQFFNVSTLRDIILQYKSNLINEQVDDYIKILLVKINNLNDIYEKLLQEKVLEERLSQLSSSIGWKEILTGKTVQRINLENANNQTFIIQLCLDAYFLTEEILADMGLIKPGNFIVTYASKSGNVFLRDDSLKITAEDIELRINENKDGLKTYGMRLKSTSIRSKIKAKEYLKMIICKTLSGIYLTLYFISKKK